MFVYHIENLLSNLVCLQNQNISKITNKVVYYFNETKNYNY